MDLQTLQTLQEWEKEISDSSHRQKLVLAADWADCIPALGGVYVIWDDTNGNAVYVGETCHLQHRLSDMARAGHHGFLKKIRTRPEMQIVDELLFSKALAEHFSLSYLVLSLGRIEFEEYLLFRWHATLLNKKPARFKYRQDIEDWRKVHE
jgi:hypothetical protein